MDFYVLYLQKHCYTHHNLVKGLAAPGLLPRCQELMHLLPVAAAHCLVPSAPSSTGRMFSLLLSFLLSAWSLGHPSRRQETTACLRWSKLVWHCPGGRFLQYEHRVAGAEHS